MNRFTILRNVRLLQLLGLTIAVIGLAGFWLSRDVERASLSDAQRALLGIEGNEFHASFVMAGKDIFYSGGIADPIYNEEGEIVGWDYQGYTDIDGINTDTILYVSIVGDDITMIAIPRDVYLADVRRRINLSYYLEGSEGLKRRIEALLGLPVDYYAIINIEIFQEMVDVLDGVEVNIPYPMHYDDNAGDLHIHFDAGPQMLSGEDASKFIRYRDTVRGDIDRLDNVKRLAFALLSRLKQLNIRAVTRLSELADTFFSQVETNASPTLLRQLILRVGNLRLAETTTLPTIETQVPGVGQVLEVDRKQVSTFLAATFGGSPRIFAETPEATVLITNRSGQEGLEQWYLDRLIGLGIPEERLLVREASFDPSPTRVVATVDSWSDADYYASLLHAGKQQIDRLPAFQRTGIDLEVVLGEDAVHEPALTGLALRPEATP